MTYSKLAKIRKALRVFFPTPTELLYARRIKNSGLFDREFYFRSNPALHPIFRLYPERHYVQIGESIGLQPNHDFSPKAYLRNNPDLRDVAAQPLRHYISIGQFEERVTKDPPLPEHLSSNRMTTLRGDRSMWPSAPFAIVVHLYYHDLWAEISATLKAQFIEFDLFVSVVKLGNDTNIMDEIHRDFPDARAFYVPNHGRDIFPFVHLVNAGLLEGYQAVCKIHSKKSPHRQDGDSWRRHLIDGVLGEPEKTMRRLSRFVAVDDMAFWVADGQYYRGVKWWGANFDRATELLMRLEIQVNRGSLAFPAGSMYWVKPLMLDLVRGMNLQMADFEPEFAQVDGTTAHALERALGFICDAASQKVMQASEIDSFISPPVRPKLGYVSAFYLPQFHPVAENDQWWGEGFTEWTSVVNAQPSYEGHSQPFLPSSLGFYDLRVPETLRKQAELACQHGIDAFCVYHYWFDGRRILEQPIDMLMRRTEINFPFYLCWANESWRRTWDGLSGEVLMDQTYKDGFAVELAQNVSRYFRDRRYQRPDGRRPRFIIYRPSDIPDPVRSVNEMRDTWRREGIGEVELGAVRFHISGGAPLPNDLFDFWVEMPPHGSVTADDYLLGGGRSRGFGAVPNLGFKGLIYDYKAVAARSISRDYTRALPEKIICGVMPSWDNTARRGLDAHIAFGANPATFRAWLVQLVEQRLNRSYRGELFINAWNEWGEKAVMEPSQKYGAACLRVLASFAKGI